MSALSARIGAIAGIVFAVLLVGGLFLIGDFPDSDAPDQEIIDFYNDSANLNRVIIGGYAWVIAATLFLVFTAALAGLLRKAEGEGAFFSVLVLVGGVAFTGTALISAVAMIAVPGAIQFGDSAIPSPDFGRIIPQLGFGILLLGGGFTAALMILAASIATIRTAALPAWSAWLGFVCSFALLFAAIFLPMVALPLWVLAISITMLARPAPA